MNETITQTATINRIHPRGGVTIRRYPESDLRTEAQPPLHGRVALVTGAGQGIGRCAAIALAQHGAVVAANCQTAQGETDTLGDVIAAFGSESLPVCADIADEKSCAEMVDHVLTTLGHIDILVHTAVIPDDGPFRLMHHRRWDDTLRIHLGGAFNCAPHRDQSDASARFRSYRLCHRHSATPSQHRTGNVSRCGDGPDGARQVTGCRKRPPR